jgi:RNA polymerase sigma factor (sigma-70 family)
MDRTDQELLRDYVTSGSEDAFRELVERHLGLVYSAARRQLRDSDLAQDVAQEVFSLLVRKASCLAPNVVLAGWLYRAAWQIASEHLRRETRRSHRESAAMTNVELPANVYWQEIESDLDQAMASLNQADHDALVLRYFENQSLRQVGHALGLSEDAAQKRLSRALDKLKGFLSRRGKAMTTSALAAAMASSAVQAPPAALAATICSAAVTSAATSAAAIGLVQSITLMKTQLAVGVALLALMGTPLVLQRRTVNQLEAENQALQRQLAFSGPTGVKLPVSSQADPNELSRLRQEHAELMRLRGEVGTLRRELAAAKTASLPVAKPLDQDEGSGADDPEEQARQLSQNTINVMKNLGLGARVFATDNSDQYPTNFVQMTNLMPAKLPGGLALDGFEFMPHPRAISEREPELILFREKVPRQLPDGRWARAYTLADGEGVEQITSDGNFDAYEKAHTASGPVPFPPPGPPQMNDALLRRYGLKQ